MSSKVADPTESLESFIKELSLRKVIRAVVKYKDGTYWLWTTQNAYDVNGMWAESLMGMHQQLCAAGGHALLRGHDSCRLAFGRRRRGNDAVVKIYQ